MPKPSGHHFQTVREKARPTYLNSGQWGDDHLVGIDQMIKTGKYAGGGRTPRILSSTEQ